jgi:hypothetical protein
MTSNRTDGNPTFDTVKYYYGICRKKIPRLFFHDYKMIGHSEFPKLFAHFYNDRHPRKNFADINYSQDLCGKELEKARDIVCIRVGRS